MPTTVTSTAFDTRSPALPLVTALRRAGSRNQSPS
jgi:hypothetical protein